MDFKKRYLEEGKWGDRLLGAGLGALGATGAITHFDDLNDTIQNWNQLDNQDQLWNHFMTKGQQGLEWLKDDPGQLQQVPQVQPTTPFTPSEPITTAVHNAQVPSEPVNVPQQQYTYNADTQATTPSQFPQFQNQPLQNVAAPKPIMDLINQNTVADRHQPFTPNEQVTTAVNNAGAMPAMPAQPAPFTPNEQVTAAVNNAGAMPAQPAETAQSTGSSYAGRYGHAGTTPRADVTAMNQPMGAGVTPNATGVTGTDGQTSHQAGLQHQASSTGAPDLSKLKSATGLQHTAPEPAPRAVATSGTTAGTTDNAHTQDRVEIPKDPYHPKGAKEYAEYTSGTTHPDNQPQQHPQPETQHQPVAKQNSGFQKRYTPAELDKYLSMF